MKRSLCFAALAALLPLLFSCEVAEETRSGHINHGYLSSYGKDLMENSVIFSASTVADILDIQEFLRLSDNEQNADENYELRSRIVSKDKAGEIEVKNYGTIQISGSGIDEADGEWRAGNWIVNCVESGHWTMKVAEENSSSIFRFIEYAADIRRETSSPKKYTVSVTDAVAYDSEGSEFAIKFRTEKEFTVEPGTDNADGVFYAEVTKDGSALDWVRITATSRIGQGYRISVESSRE